MAEAISESDGPAIGANESPAGHVLHRFEALVRGTVIARPSKVIKSPYVADVALADSGEITQAHSPALGLSGYICAGAVVDMTFRANGAKTTHTIQLVHSFDVDHNDIAVGANPNTANTIMRTVLTDNLLPSVFGHVDSVASEVTFASSRFDFVVNDRRIIEVKCAPVVDYHPSDPHPFLADTPMSSTLLRDDYRRKAIFPDGFQKKKGELVSERAYKHLVDMVQLVAEGYECFIVFVVLRNDVHSFSANWERDAGYAAQLKVAAEAGVNVVALCVRWNDRGECLFDHLLDVQIDCPDNLDEVRELRKAARKAVMQAARKREVTEDEPADNGDQLEHAEAEVDRGGVAQPSNSGEPAQPEVVSKGRRRVARRRTK